MSKLNVDQKTIYELFSDKRADFLIPDYQRPYAWSEEQCQTLWDDIFSFAFPENNADNFDDRKDEYFLGSIVTYKNENDQSEIIDGQQRLTTLLLLLRAFFDKFANMQDQSSQLTKKRIESCIWKTDTFGEAVKSSLKSDSESATDDDKGEFLELRKTGNIIENSKSRYVINYLFFKKKIDEFLQQFPSYFAYLPARILGNCILLPIEADSQDTALRIFSTLNDRGLPLSDADIFKAQFYKFYGKLNKKDEFIKAWKELEKVCNDIFMHNTFSSPMDEIFSRYMYYLRAKEGNKSSTTEALRKFYERDKYKYLNSESTICDLKELADFWYSVKLQDKTRFSDQILKKLYILHYSPNGMWQNITSAYFLHNKKENGFLDDEKFQKFLEKITAFIFTYAITNPGVNALRTPVYDEMVNIVNNKEVTFSKYKFNEVNTKTLFKTYVFTNQRNVTRSIITWYAFNLKEQKLLQLTENFHLEHIFSRKRYQMENGIDNINNLESLGNKILLEESINIKASDYRFEDKKKIYSGEQRRGKNQDKSQIYEISELVLLNDFTEESIINRSAKISEAFFDFLRDQELLSDS